MPTTGDLYRFYDADNRLLYVGISLHAAQRASEHSKQRPWWPDVVRMEVEKVDVDRLAEAEREAIRRERPEHNKIHNLVSQTTTVKHQRTRRVSELSADVDRMRSMLRDAPIAVTVQGAAEMLGVTRPTIYALVKRGELRLFKIGRSSRIPLADIYALAGVSVQ